MPHSLFSARLAGGGVGQYRLGIMEPSSEGTIGPTSAQAVRRRERFVRWRRVQALGGFVLACCFFLPAVEGCRAPVIPAEEVYDAFSEGIESWPHLWHLFAVFLAAYVFGLLVCMIGLCAGEITRSDPIGIEVSIAVVLGIVVVGLLVVVLVVFVGDPAIVTQSLGFVLTTLVVLFSLRFLHRTARLGAAGLLHLRWYAALCCTAWFMLWLPGKTYYGLWLSIVGSVAILVGATGEAAVRARTTWRPAIRLLLTSRAKLYDDDLPRCEQCGYILIGLTEQRCPECGLPFEMINPPRGLEPARAPGPSGSG